VFTVWAVRQKHSLKKFVLFAPGIDVQNLNSYFVKHVCISKRTYRSLMVSEQLPESYLREKPDPVAKGSVVTDASYGASRRRETELSLKFY